MKLLMKTKYSFQLIYIIKSIQSLKIYYDFTKLAEFDIILNSIKITQL